MSYYYSVKEQGFFNSEIHKDIPEDAIQITDEYYNVLLNGQSNGKQIITDENGYPILLDLSKGKEKEIYLYEFEENVLKYLDNVAKERGYDDIISLCSYATSSNEQFRKEGIAGNEFRDKVWIKFFELSEQIKNGERDLRISSETLCKLLPEIVWPD
jgi:hypothetical protein